MLKPIIIIAFSLVSCLGNAETHELDLKTVLQRVLSNNHELIINSLEQDAVMKEIDHTKTDLWPRLELSFFGDRSRFKYDKNSNLDASEGVFRSLSAQIRFDLISAYQALLKKDTLKSDLKIKLFEKRIIEAQLEYKVEKIYLNILALVRLKRFLSTNLSIVQKNYSRAKKKYDLGALPLNSLLKLESVKQEAEIHVLKSKNFLGQEIAFLKSLLNIPISDEVNFKDINTYEIAYINFKTSQAPFKKSLRAELLQLEIDNLELGIYEKSYSSYPEISIFSSISNNKSSNLFDPVETASFGIGLQWETDWWLKTVNKNTLETLEKRKLLEKNKNFELNYQMNLTELIMEIENRKEMVKSLKSYVNTNQKIYELEFDLFKSGTSDLDDFLESYSKYIQAKLSLSKEFSEYVIQIANFKYAVRTGFAPKGSRSGETN